MKNKPTLTIGIPAYNEENNIKYLLNTILIQNESNYYLKKIIVVSDLSTDNTDSLVKSVKDKRIQLIRNRVRRGQNFSQNHIFKIADSDIVVLLEADSCPKYNNYISNLISPILNNAGCLYVQGKCEPLEPSTKFEHLLYLKDNIFLKVAEKKFFDEKLFISGLGGRAFAKKLYKKIRWPQNVPDDLYCFYWCKVYDIKTLVEKSAVCNFRLPQTINDHLLKINKAIAGAKVVDKHFPIQKYNYNYKISRSIIIKFVFTLILSYPLLFPFIVMLKFIEKIFISNIIFSNFLQSANSTKTLFNNIEVNNKYEK
ncbi:MAG: hypothetical protein COU81_00655 [Candidatus Portnoybacteria bacterium CG10_big_fil_rev_8_21_14_0_10_36_7]|uniref:Glycosyltransferase 2-like domain-containing protein n=1 Tax=Candidatus Portnoybacteria bacterium CG10_big_fil_rev_8_21_14_0_10_36_7 TaxID=1974812 RepID=A0A2M8KEW8_9BACT|nr:MAG: hypothetical protein COU81_00655 [Candidatus Portnoybacteria bacterium CG10_big_fil_rev_8_21_14_0_10_36_7]